MKYFLLIISILTVTLSEGYAQFNNHIISNRAINITDVDVADLDGDGDLDILSASGNDRKIAWYRNDGNNQIEVQFLLQSDIDPIGIVHAADIDQDGDIDVLSSSSSKILLYTNLGNGIFEESKIIISDVGDPNRILSGDINKDGRMDIIVANGYLKGLYWYEQLEDNTFGERKNISFGTNVVVEYLAIADIEGDGDLDLAASFSAGNSNTKKLSVFLNNLNSGFQEVEILSQTSNIGLGKVEFASINEDEFLDIVYQNTKDGELIWYAGEGNGSFGEKQLIYEGSSKFCVADFNADGITDLCMLGGNCLFNDGTGSFTLQNSTTSSSGNDFLAADLNGNGSQDVLWCSYYDIAWRANNGEGIWQEENVVVSELRNPFFAQGMDVDKDGDLDIIGASSDGELVVWYENFGDSAFGSSNLIYQNNSIFNRPSGAALMDLDENGSEDVVIALQGESSIIWYTPDNQGNMIESGSIENFSDRVTELIQADLDRDGDLDLITFDNNNNKFLWYRHEGSGQFAEASPLVSLSWNPRGAAMVDVNKDGNQDLIMFTRAGNIIQWFEGQGDGTFIEHPRIVDGNFEINDVQIEDFDADGHEDILYVDDLGAISIIKSNGDGTWLTPSLIYDELNYFELKKVADINGDGLTDFFIEFIGEIHVLLQIDLGVFFPPLKISNKEIHNLFIVDLNQDGKLDLLNCDDNIIWHENQLGDNNPAINVFTFNDWNENGQHEEEEPTVFNQLVEITPNASAIEYFSLGDYTAYFVEPNQYTVSFMENSLWKASTDNQSYDIDATKEGEQYDIQFGLKPTRILPRMNLQLVSGPTRCNSSSSYWLSYENTGTTVLKGVVSFTLDERMGDYTATPNPDYTEGRTLYWNFETLYPTHKNKVKIVVQMPDEAQMGTMIKTTAMVELLNTNGELVLAKDTDYDSELLCSYDPNDKLAASNLLGQSEFAYIEDTILYTIRFQNTGNDVAFNIRIEDTLDKKLDLTTFHPITASHDYRTELNRETGLVTFYFDDIMLPDSTTNEEESHGFVMFGIASLEGIADKTELDNTASIFFDFNPPIITNTATLTLIEQVETDIEAFHSDYSIHVFPNPFSDYTTIEVSRLLEGNYQLQVMDILGRNVQELDLKERKASLERGDLESGLYLMRVLEKNSNRILGSAKVMINR